MYHSGKTAEWMPLGCWLEGRNFFSWWRDRPTQPPTFSEVCLTDDERGPFSLLPSVRCVWRWGRPTQPPTLSKAGLIDDEAGLPSFIHSVLIAHWSSFVMNRVKTRWEICWKPPTDEIMAEWNQAEWAYLCKC